MESPPTKKRKTASAGSDQGAKGGTKTKGREALQLPATVWVSVFQYLSLSDVMRALLISRSVAFDASKEVTELNVMRSSELDARISRRFPNVEFLSLIFFLGSQVGRFLIVVGTCNVALTTAT